VGCSWCCAAVDVLITVVVVDVVTVVDVDVVDDVEGRRVRGINKVLIGHSSKATVAAIQNLYLMHSRLCRCLIFDGFVAIFDISDVVFIINVFVAYIVGDVGSGRCSIRQIRNVYIGYLIKSGVSAIHNLYKCS